MIAAFVVAVLSFGANPVAPSFDTTGWGWQSTITVQQAYESGFTWLPLASEVLDKAQPALNDMRIVDDTGALTPFVVSRPGMKPAERTEWREARILNQSFQPQDATPGPVGGYARATLDFGEQIQKNRLRIVTSDANFRRRVMVEGSNDNITFDRLLEGGYLFDVSLPNNQRYQVDEATLPDNDFRYLRVTVYAMADDPRTIVVSSVRASATRQVAVPEPVEVLVASIQKSQDDKTRETIYDLDLEYRNLPVCRIAMATKEPYFYRGYELLGRNEARETIERRNENGGVDKVERDVPWTPITRGVLYRVQEEGRTSEQLRIDGILAPYRYLQLRIANQDNAPIMFDRMDVARQEIGLVFDYRTDRQYRLLCGNAKALPPHFDLALAAPKADEKASITAQTGPMEALADAVPKQPWTERYAIVVTAALILAVGIVVWMIVKNLANMRRPTS